MSRNANNDNSNSIALFPFLAVLMSTMGALLVVLVILAQRAGERAAVEMMRGAPEVLVNDTSKLTRQLDEVRRYKKRLADLRKQGEARVREEQARLSHVEEHTRRLEHELAQLTLASKQLEATEKNQTVDQEQAAAELERLKQTITDTEKQLEELRKGGNTKKSYAVVPYQGRNGTYRMPIYIECSAQGIVLQPEGLRFEETDFVDPTWTGNPLAAALRASREYLNKKAAQAGEPEPPDPYPLILVRPDGTRNYMRARQAITSWDSDFGYEFIDQDWKVEYPDLPDPQLAREQQHAVMNARERLMHLVRAAPSQFRGVAMGIGRGGGTGGGYGSGPGGDDDGSALANAYGGPSDTGNGSVGGGDLPAADDGSGRGGDSTSSGEFQYGAMSGAPTTGGGTYAGGPGGNSASGGPGSAAGSNTSGDFASSNGSLGQATGAGSTGTPGAPANSGSAMPTDYVGAMGGAPSAAGGGSGGPGDPGPGGGVPAGQPTTAADAHGGAQFSMSVPRRPAKASIAESRGSDWAVEKAMRNAIPVQRPIQVVVRQNQIALLPSRHAHDGVEATGTVISLDQSLDRISDEFIAALKTRVDEWGLAGNGLYWRPVLELHVGPDAAETAMQLNHLLKDSGVEVRLPATARSQQGGGNYAPR